MGALVMWSVLMILPERSPNLRLPGRADLGLWRTTLRERLALGERHDVFVRATEAGDVASLLGFGIRAEVGRYVPVNLRTATLHKLMQAPGNFRVRRARPHRVLLSESIPEVGADLVHRGDGVGIGRDGRGVMVGIIDTGIDLTHPDFLDAEQRSRVIAVWDQDTPGRGPPNYGYGHECTRSDILGHRCNITDPVGHGTHVAGIAAGTDGVAPAADIAVVRSRDFTRLADALHYLWVLADERDQPLVVNLSVGGHYGAHDGRTPLEEYIEELAGEGVLFVAASGNDGLARVHLGVDLTETARRVALADVPVGTPTDTVIELWSAPNVKVDVALELWVDGKPRVVLPLAAGDDEFDSGTLGLDGQKVVHVTYGSEFIAEHGAQNRTLLIDGTGGKLPSGGSLALRLAGRGRIDGWITAESYHHASPHFATRTEAGWLAGDSQASITVPATSRAVITVGSYTLRPPHEGGLARGALSPFSSVGPSTDMSYTGYKPDMAAPGAAIMSSRAATVRGASGPRMALQGTSMAAPHVTGALALMLQADPTLTPERARRALTSTARADVHTGAVPNNGWGYGKLDVTPAVRYTENNAPGCAGTPGLAPWLFALLWRRRRHAHRSL
jgi:subtilisin family serine protease